MHATHKVSNDNYSLSHVDNHDLFLLNKSEILMNNEILMNKINRMIEFLANVRLLITLQRYVRY